MGELLASRALAGAFDGLAQQVHGQPLLAYLDNAATTHMPQSVRQAMEAFERASRANIHRGVHTLSQRATDAYEQARATLKRFLGATAEHELVFTSGTTESLNLVANGLSDAAHGVPVLRPGRRDRHHRAGTPRQPGAVAAGRAPQRARLLVLRPDADGRLHADDLARLLGPRTRVFAVTACANATGERPPYEALLALAAEAGALTVLDAAQAGARGARAVAAGLRLPRLLGPQDVRAHGQRRAGGRRAALEQLSPLRFGGDMVEWVSETGAGLAELPMRLEGGTPNVAGAVGLAAAAEFIDLAGRDAVATHVTAPCAPTPCSACRPCRG